MKQISIENDFLSLKVLDYGGIIQELSMKDRNKSPIPLVVGLDNPSDYLTDLKYLGACVGRFAGRISGSFMLDGKEYPLHTVAPEVHLHGGDKGFSRKYWQIEEVNKGETPFIRLSYCSDHMEEGYPGRMEVQLTYTLNSKTLRISHQATSDRKTVVNLVNHSYFRLDDSGDLTHHRLQLNCSEYLETKENLLPTGNILHVAGSPFDFREVRAMGDRSLDTPFLIDKNVKEAAVLYSEKSGISMRVKTNQPAMVVYTPSEFAGICFETQNLPDAPNMPHFPSSVLKPGMVYDNSSEFCFEYA